jgi:hypothetical protein
MFEKQSQQQQQMNHIGGGDARKFEEVQKQLMSERWVDFFAPKFILFSV